MLEAIRRVREANGENQNVLFAYPTSLRVESGRESTLAVVHSSATLEPGMRVKASMVSG
jgi:hypothetical protein